MNDSALRVGLKAPPNSLAVEHLMYNVKGCEFETHSGSVIFLHSLLIIFFIVELKEFNPGLCFSDILTKK